MSSKNLIGFGVIYTLAGTIQKGIGFIAFMYLAVVLTVPDYALFGIYYALFTLVSSLSYSGIIEAVISLLKKFKDENGKLILFKASSTVFLILSGLTFITMLPVQYFFYRENFNSIIEIILILGSAILFTYFIFQSFLVRLNEEHKESLIFSFIPQILGYLFGFIMASQIQTALSFFLGATFGYLISLGLFGVKSVRFLGFSKDYKIIKLLLFKLGPFSLIALITWFLGYGNTFIIDFFFLDEQVAIFIFLFTISSVLQLIASSMNQVWSPKFYNLFSSISKTELNKKYEKFTLFQGLVLGCSGLFILFVFPYLGLLSSKLQVYTICKTELMWLFIGYVVSIPWWQFQNYYFINDLGKRLLKVTIISGLVGFSFWILSMYLLGSIGIYIGFFINSLVRSMIINFDSYKIWQISFNYSSVFVGLIIILIINFF